MDHAPRAKRAQDSSCPTGASEVRHRLPAPARVPEEARAFAPSSDVLDRSGRERTVSGVEMAPVGGHSLPPPLARIGRYDVLGRIAVGGMAEIYLCREPVQTGTARHTALKLLRRRSSDESDERYFEELFLREGRTASQLVHPNICHVYEFGRWQGDYFIAMEFIDGLPLREVLAQLERRQVLMAPVLAAGIAAQVAGALEYAHTARDARRRPLGVVHLDVTPQNIMLRHDGAVKLLDFGVAQVSDPQADSRSDTIKGKTGYLAPEQVLQKPLDGRVDVFALGVCLFEMLSGTRLFRRENLRATLEALLKEPIPSLSSLRSDIPSELDGIVQKALSRDRAARFQSAGELQAALEGFLARSREVVSNRHIATLMVSLFPDALAKSPVLYTGPEAVERLARKDGTSELLLSGAPTPADPEPTSASSVRKAPSRALRWGIVAIALVLAVAAGLWNRRSEPQGAPQASLIAPAQLAPVPSQRPSPTELAERVVPSVIPAPSAATLPAQPQVSDSVKSVAGEPAAAPEPAAPAGTRPIRRRSSPGFVADPGF